MNTKFNYGFNFFCLTLEIQLLNTFDPNNLNCQFKLNFGSQNNSKNQNLMAVFTFYALGKKHFFWKNWSNSKC